MVVVYTGNNDLFNLLVVSATSLISQQASNLEIVVLDCGLSSRNKKLLKDYLGGKCLLRFLDIDMTKLAPLPGYRGFVDVWAKYLIPVLLPENDRAIYLDTDTICLEKLDDLYAYDLNGKSLGICPAIYYDDWRDLSFQEFERSSDFCFANTGVMLFDCASCRGEQFTERFLTFVKGYGEKLSVAVGYDELAISLFYDKNRYERVDLKFNCTDHVNHLQKFIPKYSSAYEDNEWKRCVVRHFAGSDKPWVTSCNDYNGKKLKNFDDWWMYASACPSSVYEQLSREFLFNHLDNGV